MFLETKTRIANRHGKTDSTTLTRIGEFYNDILQEAYNAIGYVDEVNDFITTVSGRMSYPLSPFMDPIQDAMLIPSQNRKIRYVTREEFERVPDHTSSGTPSRYTVIDRCGVMEQPSSRLSFASNDAADTTQTVTIKGISHYRYVTETIALNGTNAVLSTYYYSQILTPPTLSATCAGTITGTANSAAVTVCSITTGNLVPSTFLDPADTITFDSSSASDTQKATVEGMIIDATNNFKNLPYRESNTLTGTSDKTTTARFSKVRDLSLSSPAVGVIRVTAPSMAKSPAFIGIFPPGRTSLDYQIVAFDPVPDSAIEIMYKGTRTPAKLVNDGDRPSLDTRAWPVIERWTEAAFNDWKGDRRGIPFLIAQDAFQADMGRIRGWLGMNVRHAITKGQNAYPITARRTSTFHLDPNIYGPRDY